MLPSIRLPPKIATLSMTLRGVLSGCAGSHLRTVVGRRAVLFPGLVSFAYVTVAVFETVGKAAALTLTERLRMVALPGASGFGFVHVTV
jgi:hypothetical protein